MIDFLSGGEKSSSPKSPKSAAQSQRQQRQSGSQAPASGSGGKDELIVLNEIETTSSHNMASSLTIVDETATSATGGFGFGFGGSFRRKSRKQHSPPKLESPEDEYKPSKADNIYRFYITRLKHSLIISFLLLIPVQNLGKQYVFN